MNRFGVGMLPEREMPSDQPAKVLDHADIDSHVAEFLANGGAIERGISVQLRARKPRGGGSSSFARAWDGYVSPFTPAGLKPQSLQQIQRMKRRARREVPA